MSLIPDCAVAQVMAQGEVNAVIVGADRVAQNGDIINKVGTYPLALMAREYGVPFHASGAGSALAGDGASMCRSRNARRRVADVSRTSAVAAGDDQVLNARYPSFDVTPAALITHLIGFDDLYTPETFRRKYQEHGIADPEERNPSKAENIFWSTACRRKTNMPFLPARSKAEQAESILVPEMRPQLWGAQVVARELIERHVPTTLISDNMMGTLFAQGEIRKLCLFYETYDGSGAERDLWFAARRALGAPARRCRSSFSTATQQTRLDARQRCFDLSWARRSVLRALPFVRLKRK